MSAPVVVDAAMILAIGTGAGAVVGAITAGATSLIRTIREPSPSDVLDRVKVLERRVSGLVRWYHDQKVKAAAEGYDLPTIPDDLLR